MVKRMDLLALADFNLVARHGGFGRAARAAGRSKATLSRRVAELEASLDLRLFERGTRVLKLTEEGRALHERTGALLAELDETAAAIASGGAKPRGQLRISAPLLFSQVAMGKLAAEFALKHPDVRLEVSTEDRAVDIPAAADGVGGGVEKLPRKFGSSSSGISNCTPSSKALSRSMSARVSGFPLPRR
ncbi:Transcriptional regulator LysR family [Methylorubrum populi]|uniref:Transcriptional regulator LysR family n=1 Tax=Methylorubrum populi TaxID=223967 RepID=A0A833J1R8_9HYPH|nr:Transcriptional regulator LysR family [Methylorubrum populi]